MDADVAVVGAGAIGSSVARWLAKDGHEVVVLDKETGPALHQSGRNSGVVHAGYQYEPGSTKARFAREGARRLIAYCRERDIPLRQNGLLVVAQNETEIGYLEEAHRRSQTNGIEARMLEPEEIQQVEPAARGRAGLRVPAYASFDARAYVHSLTGEAMTAGAEFLYDTTVEAIEDTGRGVRVHTSKGTLEAGGAVNAAGLQADRLGQDVCPDMRIVPFRGYYAEVVADKRDMVEGHVYPAPDPELPFLGVHLSKRADGRLIVGPGAMLAFGREAYSFWGADGRDLLDTLSWPGFYRLLGDAKIRSLIGDEVHKSLSLKAMAAEARRLVPEIEAVDLVDSYAGNRAQMVSREGELVMDLVVREQGNTVHVLNAVSPGLTCSLPFGEHVAQLALERA
ncbi:L-2-hydroxyglutarate oxidase [Thermoplasmatales archaeon SW_10_69_26]|nr:MAG: L-2-hydroxyglutarate oxidase [Thermoplasmatales archaeon SW_10_69_26]